MAQSSDESKVCTPRSGRRVRARSHTLFVKTLTGKTLSFDVLPGAPTRATRSAARVLTTRSTVDELKSAVQDLEGVPVGMFTLRTQRFLLEPGRVLSDYTIPDGATLVMTLTSRERSTPAGLNMKKACERLVAAVETVARGDALPPDFHKLTETVRSLDLEASNEAIGCLSELATACNVGAECLVGGLSRATPHFQTDLMHAMPYLLRFAEKILAKLAASEEFGSRFWSSAYPIVDSLLTIAEAMPSRSNTMFFLSETFTRLQTRVIKAAATWIRHELSKRGPTRMYYLESHQALAYVLGRECNLVGPACYGALPCRLGLLALGISAGFIQNTTCSRERTADLALDLMHTLDAKLLPTSGVASSDEDVANITLRLLCVKEMAGLLSALIRSGDSAMVMQLHSLGWFQYLVRSTFMACGFETQLYEKAFNHARAQIAELLSRAVVGWEVMCANLRTTQGFEHALVCACDSEFLPLRTASQALLRALSPHLLVNPERTRRLLNMLPTFRFDPCPSTHGLPSEDTATEAVLTSAAGSASEDRTISAPDRDTPSTSPPSFPTVPGEGSAAAGSGAAGSEEEEEGKGCDAEGESGDAAHLRHITCAICACDAELGEELRVLPCNHIFHRVCCDQWITFGSEVSGVIKPCPLCMQHLHLDDLVQAEFGKAAEAATWCHYTRLSHLWASRLRLEPEEGSGSGSQALRERARKTQLEMQWAVLDGVYRPVYLPREPEHAPAAVRRASSPRSAETAASSLGLLDMLLAGPDPTPGPAATL